MGLFSAIKKRFKKVWSGIKKVFKKVLAGVGKILNSKWGKLLMLGAAIFTGGMALAGGFQAFSASAAAGNSFMANFVAGAKGFMTALANPVEQAKKMFGTAAQAGTQTAGGIAGATQETGKELAAEATKELGLEAAEETVKAGMEGTATEAAKEAAKTGLQETGKEVGRTALEDMFGKQTGDLIREGTKQVTKEPGWLSKAAEFGKEFITSPAGAKLIEGIGAGGMAEEQQKFDDRIRRRWMDPNNPLAQYTRQQQGFTIERGGPPRFSPTGGITPAGAGISPTTAQQPGGMLPGEPAPVG